MKYCYINGLSYMCLGETVLILLAIQLKCSDTVIAVLGAMIYFGFVLLPMGKWMTAKVGAAKSQAYFWFLRNAAALTVAAAAPASVFGSQRLAMFLLLSGAFIFYGFRAAGVVMSQPLLGEICAKEHLGSFISFSTMAFYVSGLISLLVITLLLKLCSSIWTLFGIVVTGAALGVTAGTFVCKIHETGEIRKYAGKSLLPDLRQVFRNRKIKMQMYAGMVCNLAVIMSVPISMLTLKRGYAVNDSAALLYSLVQFGSCIVCSLGLAKAADHFSGRKLTLFGFCGFYLIALLWIFCPTKFNWIYALLPFIFAPFGTVIAANALIQYFLGTTPKSKQVTASMMIAVATGAVSGLAGMIISSLLLKFAAFFSADITGIRTYRLYFFFVLILLPALNWIVYRLPEDCKAQK